VRLCIAAKPSDIGNPKSQATSSLPDVSNPQLGSHLNKPSSNTGANTPVSNTAFLTDFS
jgi:hypothetical protein